MAAEWKRVTPRDEGGMSFRVELKDGEISDALVVMGARLGVKVGEGPVDVLGVMAEGDDQPLPLRDLRNVSLTNRSRCIEGVAEPVYALYARGTGTVTVFAVGRR